MPDAAGLAEPLASRWSPSLFDAAHVLDDDAITVLLQAARWAPSWGNSQPATWVVAPRGSRAHDLLLPTLSRGNAGWVPRASVVLVGAVQVAPDPADAAAAAGGAAGGADHEPAFALYDLGQAAAHLTLQAQAMGLHTHQFAGFDRDAFAAAVGVPAHVRLMAASRSGCGSIRPRRRARRSSATATARAGCAAVVR